MKKTRGILFLSLAFLSMNFVNADNINITATNTCEELSKKYERELLADANKAVFAESNNTCAIAVVTQYTVKEIDKTTTKVEQHFIIVNKDGKEVRKQQLQYNDKTADFFPKIERILVKSSGDFYPVSYKRYPSIVTSFKEGLGYIARVSKENGNILWETQAKDEKGVYTFSDTKDIIEGDVTTLIGNRVKELGTEYGAVVYIPQITQIKNGVIVDKSLFSNYENYEIIAQEKLTNNRYVIKFKEIESLGVVNPKTREIVVDQNFKELVGETRESVINQKATEDKKELTVEVQNKESSAQKEAKKENTNPVIWFLIGGVSLLCLGIGIYYFIQRKDRKEKTRR